MVMMTGVMLAGCGKSTEKPAEQEAPVEAQVEESADEAESKEASDGAGDASTETTSESDFELGRVGDVTGIVKYTGNAENVVIPDTIDGVTITAIGNAFNGNETIKSVVIPDTVEIIGESTFACCSSLETVVMSSNIKVIEDSAFRICSNLKNINLPEGLESIGETAFSSTALEEIELPSTIKKLEYGTFGITKLKSITLPEGMEMLDDQCFYDCEQLEKVYIPASVTEIHENAFSKSDNITIITTAGSYAETYANENGIPCEIQ